ncbi:MAG: MFS transporter [Oscillospiraceae bacterium]|jgi:MFS family permease|nr:MFS transporter [Oscillospiraceae bacterium]
MMSDDKTSGILKFWALIWGLGLAGQLCWNVVNQWFNTFIYAKIAMDSNIVTTMVISTSVVSTFSTFFFGTLSDRIGSRRRFVTFGYIIWGVFTIVFGFTEYIGGGVAGDGSRMLAITAVLVVLTGCVMSFFGSMANDSGFNAWINDMTTDTNRGQLGGALATQPVIGTIVGTVVGGMLIGSQDNYQRLFWTMGLFVISMGIISTSLLRDAPTLKPHREGNFWKQFFSVFNFKVLFSQRELMLACLIAIAFFIPFNVFFVHMGNWLIYRMGFTPDLMGLIQGTALIAAMLLAIPGMFLINKQKTPFVAIAGVTLNAIGIVAVSLFIRPGVGDNTTVFTAANIPLIICVFFVGSGLILLTQSVTMWVKQLYPEKSRGQFEGIRLLSFMLIPMVIGTLIGNIIIRRGEGSVVNEFGIIENIPTESIFRWAAILLIPIIVPLYFASKLYFKRVKES